VSLLGALQFAGRFLALTGSSFENQDWPFPETDPFVQASGLTHEALSQLIITCQASFQSLLKTMDLDV
jgi:hypothetical protein